MWVHYVKEKNNLEDTGEVKTYIFCIIILLLRKNTFFRFDKTTLLKFEPYWMNGLQEL